MNLSVLGIDIAKLVFHLHGVDAFGRCVYQRKLRRKELLECVAKLPRCVIGLEACGSSNYWSREFTKLGHEVRIVSARFVKPYVKSHKNDAV